MLSCTHVVLYVKNISATHSFYVFVLGCPVRRYAPEEDFLSVLVGDFILNFYGPKLSLTLAEGYNQGVCHIGFELATRFVVERYFAQLQEVSYTPLASDQQPLETLAHLLPHQTAGPYRFYLLDPDGYRVEIHTWEGVEGS